MINYGVALAFVGLFYLFYKSLHIEQKQQREQVAELRRVMDYQLDGLRHEFREVKHLLAWLEPHVPGITGYIAVRHTGITSVNELVTALNEGRYDSALVPWSTLQAPISDGRR